ncbi:uncharacterized protein LOC106054917 isoform X2 [Biomphalaria glabrata]|uniref:Uncharacterized protein LOC106054917 isoform X2 n=1 Tax=Biomphalaria glabrata TaxID=6526 RepID=A0A9W2YAS6_BIOGL|nr:uncharacterized protein LOC106054917 isoform X2 [Biomphalaria glabrata]
MCAVCVSFVHDTLSFFFLTWLLSLSLCNIIEGYHHHLQAYCSKVWKSHTMKPKVFLLLTVTSLFVRVQSLSVSFEETNRVENSVSLKCRWETQANEEPTEVFVYKNSKLYYQCSLGQSDVSICSAEEISPSRFSYFYQESENTIRVNIKNMISSDSDFYSCYVKQRNATISGQTLYLPLRRDITTSITTSAVTKLIDTTPKITATPGTKFTNTTPTITASPDTKFTNTTPRITASPDTKFTNTTPKITATPDTKFTNTTPRITASPDTKFTNTTTNIATSPFTKLTGSTTAQTETNSQDTSSVLIYIVASVASTGLVSLIVGVICFFVIRKYRTKKTLTLQQIQQSN